MMNLAVRSLLGDMNIGPSSTVHIITTLMARLSHIFFLNDAAATDIYTTWYALSPPDALPITIKTACLVNIAFDGSYPT